MRIVPKSPLPQNTLLQSGKFRIESHLGSGAFGLAYSAFDTSFHRTVAIKEFFPNECRRAASNLVPGGEWTASLLFQEKLSFAAEGRTLAAMEKHLGIVAVHDIFEENETVYLVMEFVEGQTLKDYVAERGGQLPIEEALDYIRQAGEALSVVHAANRLHRDLKPGNIMRRDNGKIVLIDFGAAREFTPELEQTLTEIKTPGFAAPEQHTPKAVWGHYTDIYGLSATLYRMITGKIPVDARSRQIGFPFPAPIMIRPDVPQLVSGAIMKGMAMPPAERPQTVAEFLALLAPQRVTLPKFKINPKDGQKMILIPAGDFLMGDDDMSHNPRRTVNLDSYYIAETPVTVWQYEKFCRETRRNLPSEPECPSGNKFNPGWRYKDHPIVNVNWQDASDYCEWAGMQLPTEAQWEKATRGTGGRTYPWGEDWDSGKCRCSLKAYGDSGGTATVGSYPNGASPYGVLDMAGNVWEWCEDFYDANYFQTAPPKNPVNLNKSVVRVLRGGSWGDFNPVSFRASNRGDYNPSFHIFFYDGFRCAAGHSFPF